MKEESEKAGLKLNIQKTKIMAPSPITSWQIEGEKAEAVTDFLCLGSKITAQIPDVQAGFRKGRGNRDQIANICWIIEKARQFQKNIYFSFTDNIKVFDFVDHNKLENS